MPKSIARNPQTLIDAIRKAFEGVCLDGGTTLHEARAMDNYEPREVQLAQRELDPEIGWEEISDDKLTRFYDTQSFMCPKGFRFYIPAFMIWILNGRDAGFGGHTIYSFILPDSSASGYQDRLRHFAIFDAAQREAIREFLEYLVKYRPLNSRSARDALERYWGKRG